MSEKKFRFWVPLDKIEKSKDAGGVEIMKLGGIASTSARDTDGESLDTSNFDISYLKNQGIVNWNHRKDPDAVIGEPIKAELRKEGLYVESMLYGDSDLAKSVYALAQRLQKNSTKRRLGYSIEGKATERDPNDETIVTKAMITNVALTINPKNPGTLVDIVKGDFNEFEETETYNREISALDEVNTLIKAFSSPEERKNIVTITREDGTRILVNDNYEVNIEKALSAGSETGTETTNQAIPGSGAPLKEESLNTALKDLKKIKTTKKDDEDEDKDDEEKKEKKNDSVVLTKAQAFEKIFNAFPGIGFEKAENIIHTLNNLAMKSEKSQIAITDDLLEKAISNLKKRGEDEDEDIEKSPVEEEDEKDEDETIEKAEKDEDEEEEEDANEEEEDSKEEGEGEDNDEDEDDEDDEDDVEKGITFEGEFDIEKAIRDTSHLVLKNVTDKNGKVTRKWTDPNKGEKHHDIKPGSAVKYEHKGKEHVGEVKFVARNGQYVLDTKKHGVVGKHPHQVKKHNPNISKGIEDEVLEAISDNTLEKALESVKISTDSGFKNVGIILKGIYDLQKKQSEENVELKNQLEKSLSRIDELEENIQKGIEDFGNTSLGRKSIVTSKAREKEFIQGDAIQKSLADEGTGTQNTLSISKQKNKILTYLDHFTFEKGLDNDMAKAMTVFESGNFLEPIAIAKFKQKGITIVS